MEEIPKTEPNSDWRLQLASMKPESLVMAYQLRRREYVPGPCTHPVTSWELVTPEVGDLTAREELPRVGLMTGTKS